MAHTQAAPSFLQSICVGRAEPDATAAATAAADTQLVDPFPVEVHYIQPIAAAAQVLAPDAVSAAEIATLPAIPTLTQPQAETEIRTDAVDHVPTFTTSQAPAVPAAPARIEPTASVTVMQPGQFEAAVPKASHAKQSVPEPVPCTAAAPVPMAYLAEQPAPVPSMSAARRQQMSEDSPSKAQATIDEVMGELGALVQPEASQRTAQDVKMSAASNADQDVPATKRKSAR